MTFEYKTFQSSGYDLKIVLKKSPCLALLANANVDSCISVVAYEDDMPIGVLIARELMQGDLYIAHINVSPCYHRRKGIGSELLKIIENIATEKSLKRLSLLVRNQNLGAKAFFEKEGFVEYLKCDTGQEMIKYINL
ncbi:hypothetical protein Bhyg_09029 [Pseudolycoriella hygida]|uniref:N-acetyltransferase domain-containing protein n=1 Tax=Pseudolycoriella hygida TaxID=35572 RepID=A0A9Q0N5R3_9DIPT|nr:hypothetical protein Bhyg_09029 [Pseudolycoriella hygida]